MSGTLEQAGISTSAELGANQEHWRIYGWTERQHITRVWLLARLFCYYTHILKVFNSPVVGIIMRRNGCFIIWMPTTSRPIGDSSSSLGLNSNICIKLATSTRAVDALLQLKTCGSNTTELNNELLVIMTLLVDQVGGTSMMMTNRTLRNY